MTEVRTLSKAPNPQLLPGQHRLPTAPRVCVLGWVKCREHISLHIILCIIVYVTNKINKYIIIMFIENNTISSHHCGDKCLL